MVYQGLHKYPIFQFCSLTSYVDVQKLFPRKDGLSLASPAGDKSEMVTLRYISAVTVVLAMAFLVDGECI